MHKERFEFQVQLIVPYPAVQILSLFCLPHTTDVGREDGDQSGENGVRLRPAGVLGEQAVHYSGAFYYQTSHILRGQETPERKEIRLELFSDR